KSDPTLAYVPMDVCWLMADPDSELAPHVPELIEALEGTSPPWSSEALYGGLLPTVGPRIIGPVIARVRAAVSEPASVETRIAADFSRRLLDAVTKIGGQHPREVSEWAARMFCDPCDLIRDTGLRVLANFPHTDVLDALWDLHKVNAAALWKDKDR